MAFAKPKQWHPEDIKAEVRKRGMSLSGLSRSVGLCDSACRVAFQKPVPAANRAIAELIGQSLHVLWPRWFDTDGNRLSSGAKNSRAVRRGHRQKQVRK